MVQTLAVSKRVNSSKAPANDPALIEKLEATAPPTAMHSGLSGQRFSLTV